MFDIAFAPIKDTVWPDLKSFEASDYDDVKTESKKIDVFSTQTILYFCFHDKLLHSSHASLYFDFFFR